MRIHFDKAKLSNIILVDHQGRPCRVITLIELSFTPMYVQHPDIISMCQAHTTQRGLAIAGLSIQSRKMHVPLKIRSLVSRGQVAVENHAGSDVAKAFTGVKAALYQNHGYGSQSAFH